MILTAVPNRAVLHVLRLMFLPLVAALLALPLSCTSTAGESGAGDNGRAAAESSQAAGGSGDRAGELATKPPVIETPPDGYTISEPPLTLPLRLDGIDAPLDVILKLQDEAGNALPPQSVQLGQEGVALPGALLQNGRRYRYRIELAEPFRLPEQEIAYAGETAARSFSVALDLPEIRGFSPPGNGITIDTTPRLSWHMIDAAALYQLELGRSSDFIDPVVRLESKSSEVAVERELSVGARYFWRVRLIHADGLSGSWSEARSFEVRDEAPIEPVSYSGGMETLSGRPFLSWRAIHGASRYELELSTTPDFSSPLLQTTVSADTFLPFGLPRGGTAADAGSSTETILFLDGHVGRRVAIDLNAGAELYYRVRARSEEGKSFDWGGPFRAVLSNRLPRFLAALEEQEAPLTFPMGYAEGDADERPVHEVTLSEPFAAMRTPVTSSFAAYLLNWGLGNGFFEIAGDELRSGGRRIAGLGEIAYGRQFSLTVEEDEIGVAAGYADHPAVGLTWYGAVALANALSVLDGREPAYTLPPTGEGRAVAWRGNGVGYRLPTEAQWEFLARGGDSRLLPWEGPLDGRRANYFRSGDPFGAVAPPYTQNGGPTTPVTMYSGTAVRGFRSLNGSGPDGHLDLLGNVWEWVWDWYDPGEYSREGPVRDPRGPADAVPGPYGAFNRVVRGCAWNCNAAELRTTNRGRFQPQEASYSIGVRLIEPLEPARGSSR